jgi:hypothetical protein
MTEPSIDIEDIFQVDARMERARQIYRGEFDLALRCLVSLTEGDPATRMIVAQIWRASDPGKQLMDWFYSNFVPRPTLH